MARSTTIQFKNDSIQMANELISALESYTPKTRKGIFYGNSFFNVFAPQIKEQAKDRLTAMLEASREYYQQEDILTKPAVVGEELEPIHKTALHNGTLKTTIENVLKKFENLLKAQEEDEYGYMSDMYTGKTLIAKLLNKLSDESVYSARATMVND